FARDAGVVHQHVELPERFARSVDDDGPLRLLADVVGERDRLATLAMNLGRGLLGGRMHEIGRDHAGAFARQRKRAGAPDPRPGPGDDRNLPLDSAHVYLLLASPANSIWLVMPRESGASSKRRPRFYLKGL